MKVGSVHPEIFGAPRGTVKMNIKTRNAWQSRACSSLSLAMSPPSEE